jgi:hypothetical protein
MAGHRRYCAARCAARRSFRRPWTAQAAGAKDREEPVPPAVQLGFSHPLRVQYHQLIPVAMT